MANLTEFFDFTTSPEFEELWNQVSEELDIQSNVSSVSSTVKETATSPNTKNTEKTSLLKTLLEKSTPSTKTLTTTTVSTSIKKPNVSLSSTPIVSCENDCKIVEVPFKSYETCETNDSKPAYSPVHDENWPPSVLTDGETTPSFLNAEDSILTTLRRNNHKRFNALEKRLTDPNMTTTREFKVLKALIKRMKSDLKQCEIIMNYLEGKYGPKPEPTPKRVKFNTLY